MAQQVYLRFLKKVSKSKDPAKIRGDDISGGVQPPAKNQRGPDACLVNG